MENEENKCELLVKTSEDLNRAFKLDYEGQSIENNNKFEKWKQLMLTKYGNDAKLFKRLKDNIYFYSSNRDYFNNINFYQSKCPICNNPICYYCSRYCRDCYFENASCCLKRKIKYIILKDTSVYINPTNEETRKYFKKYLIIFLIPIVNFLYFVARIQCSFFYKLAMKNSKLEEHGYLTTYVNHLDKKDLFITINIIFTSFLVIPYFIMHIYIILFILLISFPFKLIPLKSIIGIAYSQFIW